MESTAVNDMRCNKCGVAVKSIWEPGHLCENCFSKTQVGRLYESWERLKTKNAKLEAENARLKEENAAYSEMAAREMDRAMLLENEVARLRKAIAEFLNARNESKIAKELDKLTEEAGRHFTSPTITPRTDPLTEEEIQEVIDAELEYEEERSDGE